MELLVDRAVRVELGMSTVRASKFARVDRKTLCTYELSPTFVSEVVRERLRRFYARLRQDLADHLADVEPKPHQEGRTNGTSAPALWSGNTYP